MIIHTSNRKLIPTPQTVLLLTRLLGKGKNSENLVLAEALNLLQRPKDHEVDSPVYKPSLYDNIVKGPAQEQYRHLLRVFQVNKHSNEKRISDQFISNLLSGIKSSEVSNVNEAVNFDHLYHMNPQELSLYIKGVRSESELFNIMETFYYNDRLTFEVLNSIVLNRALVNLDKAPIDLTNIQTNILLKFDSLSITKFNIILLAKYHTLHKPLSVLRNLKQNFNDTYFPLIKDNKLSPFYERIVWKYTFEYLKQFDELHYIREINRLKSSFLILEATTKRNFNVAQYILEKYKETSAELQTIFLKIFTNPCVQQCINNEFEESRKSYTLISLQKLSSKYNVRSSKEFPMDQRQRRSCYALIADLEKFIEQQVKLSRDKELEKIGYELKEYHRKVIESNKNKESESEKVSEDFFDVVPALMRGK